MAEIIAWQPELWDDPATHTLRCKLACVESDLAKARSTLDKVRKAHWGSNNEQNQRLSSLEERLDLLERYICTGG